MGRRLKKHEVADFFGYSLPTVDAWIKEGCPVEQEGGKGKAYEFDSEKVFRWLLGREKRPGRPAKERAPTLDPETGEEVTSLDEAQRRKAVADAKAAELRLAESLSLVAPVAVISKIVSDEISKARARLLAIPTKFRPTAQMHASTPERAKKLVAAVDELIHGAMTEIKSYGGENG